MLGFLTSKNRRMIMQVENSNYFTQLSAVDVTRHLEKKGQFTYLSWPFAVSQLRQFDATASWEVMRFNGLPFLSTDSGTFVEVAVTVRGVTLSQIHPVLDARNKTIPVPSAFDINTSIQRCLVKAIALHGLGLKVYAGEDLPTNETDVNKPSLSSPTSRSVVTTLVKQKSEQVNGFSQPELLTTNQLRYIKRLMLETDTDEKLLLDYFGFDEIINIPKFEVNRVIGMLEAKREREAA
jgi:hypothetical protein